MTEDRHSSPRELERRNARSPELAERGLDHATRLTQDDDLEHVATRLIVTKRTEAARTISLLLSGGTATERTSHGVAFYAWRDETGRHVVIGVQGFLFRSVLGNGVSDWRTAEPGDLIDARLAREPVHENVHTLLRGQAKYTESVVIATDFDDEGELIGLQALEVILEANPKLAEDAGVSVSDLGSRRFSGLLDAAKIKRARYSALTKEQVRRAFDVDAGPANGLGEVSESLAWRAEARQEIDLIWGSTLTRFFSLAARRLGSDPLTVGRAELPALAIVVERELERRAHVPKPYWAVFASFEHPDGEFTARHTVGEFWEESLAHAALANTPSPGIVKSVECKHMVRRPPTPFNATSFMSAAAGIGISPVRAMQLAEDLYTQGLISYPGTIRSIYGHAIPVRDLLRSIARLDAFRAAAPLAARDELAPTCGDKWGSVHPPIHPTEAVDPAVLPEDGHREVYELIVRRFLATFADPAVWEHTRTEIETGSETYYARSNVLIEPGFLAVYPYGRFEEEEAPTLQTGQGLTMARRPVIERKETQPPPRIGQGKLIELMGEWIVDMFCAPTAPDIIQKLYDRAYIQGNPIEPSESAIALVSALTRSGTKLTTSEIVIECERLMANIWAKDEVVDDSRKLLREACDLLDQNERDPAESSQAAADGDRVHERSPETTMRARPRVLDRESSDVLATRFARAVDEAQAWFRTAFADAPAELLDALVKESTREQAAGVDDCVERFSRAELEGRALGRYGPVRVIPALGYLQAKKLRGAESDRKERVRDAVAFGVAIGYTFVAAMEEDNEPHSGRSPEEIWNVWVPNLNSGLIERTALPADMLTEVREMGASAFQKRALELGLGGFGKKARLRHIGAFYGQAGALLHLVQVHPGDLEPDPANIWAYGDNPA